MKRSIRVVGFLIVVCMTVLSGCATPLYSRATDAPRLAPPVQKQVGRSSILLGAVMGAWCPECAPKTIPPGRQINQAGSVTWLGHSGFVLQIAGQTILTDPVFSETAVTTASLGGRMARAPDLSDLKKVDAVVISHADIDHLDRPTLEVVAARFPNSVLILPKATQLLRPIAGFKRVVELSEWQSHVLGKLTITATPAIHLSQRPPLAFLRGRALSFGFSGSGEKLFFSGDTAYGPVFSEVGKRLGPFDLALVPIGAWKPEDLQNDMHMTPEQAGQLARDLGSRRVVPHHFGTFRLTPDTPTESLQLLKRVAKGHFDVIALPIGGTTQIKR